MQRILLFFLVGLLTLTGCGHHKQVVRPESGVEGQEKKPQRIINGEPAAVEAWSGNGP